jgi:hypothetical protein
MILLQWATLIGPTLKNGAHKVKASIWGAFTIGIVL